MGKALVNSLVFVVPVMAVLLAAYIGLWGRAQLIEGINTWTTYPVAFVVILVVGTLLHEFMHGLSWVYFGGKPFSAIRYGFQWKTLTPYAHCNEPMPVRPYRISAAMPGILLGLVPAFVGIATGQVQVFYFGLFFTLAAAGDALILWMIRKVEAGYLVVDHPSRAGCYVIGPAG
jgi:hypothetical protein